MSKTLNNDPSVDVAVREDGYILDTRLEGSGERDTKDLKTAADGHTILIPQPSDDVNDPLNWSPLRKHVILILVSAAAFLPDYGSTTGVVTAITQAKEWHITQNTVLHSLAGNVFMLGAGGVVVVTLIAYFGRLPVFFWFTAMSLWTAAFCAAAKSFNEFMAARILNGFFSVIAQAGALIFINDLFFLHEHARKINIWVLFIILSPYLGPLLTSFMLTKLDWRWPFWIFTIAVAVSFIAIIVLGEETYYDRSIPTAQQPVRRSRLLRLIGVEQWHSRNLRNSFLDALKRPVITLSKPTVFISLVYYLLTYAWGVGINATLAIYLQPLYHFGTKQIGFFYFAPIVATVLGFGAGHWLHDMVVKISMRRHGGHFEPEDRLWVIWLSTPFMVAGLVLVGYCLQHKYHFMLTAFAWGLYVFGLVITTVAINAYNLTAYRRGAGEVAAWVNFGRMTGGFIDTYVQVEWVTRVGAVKALGTQAGIVAAAFLLVIFLQLFGRRLRHWSGPLHFKTS